MRDKINNLHELLKIGGIYFPKLNVHIFTFESPLTLNETYKYLNKLGLRLPTIIEMEKFITHGIEFKESCYWCYEADRFIPLNQAEITGAYDINLGRGVAIWGWVPTHFIGILEGDI